MMVAPLPAHRKRLRAVYAIAPPAAVFISNDGDASGPGFFLHAGTSLFCLAATPDAPVVRSHAYR